MPLQYKLPGHIGNAGLLLLGMLVLLSQSVVTRVLLGGLAALNLFLIYKLDRFSREEV